MGFFDIFKSKKNKEQANKYRIGMEKTRGGALSRLKKLFSNYDEITDELFDELEEIFVMADIGVDTVVKYIDAKTADIASGTEFTALTDRVTQAEKDIEAIEADYLKAADKDALQEQITTNANAIELLTEGVDADKVDGVKDLIAYVEEHGAEVTGIKEDIATNAKAIEDEGKARGEADTALDNRLKAVEAAVGESGSVASDIEDAKNAAIAAAAADATAKANAAEASAKAYADGLDAAMDERVEALEADIHTHANKAELDKFVDGDKVKLDDAYAKAHEHANKAELDKIADGDVAKWNAAEQNAKNYADGLNEAMDGRMDVVEASIAEGGATATAIANAQKAADDAQKEVDALELVVATKAAQADLTALAGRVTAEEGKTADFEGRIAELEAVEHVEITTAEIDAIFANA